MANEQTALGGISLLHHLMQDYWMHALSQSRGARVGVRMRNSSAGEMGKGACLMS
jgi:hypothetical protein